MYKKAQEKMKDERKTWKIEQKKEQENLQKINEDQEFEKKNLAKKVVKVIKLSKNLVRDAVDKKNCLIIFGFKESVPKEKYKRGRREGS